MANKKGPNKIHRRATRLARKSDKAQRKQTKADHNGMGQLVNSIQERNKADDLSQAAARIVREAAEKD
jgi:hypothetical protein